MQNGKLTEDSKWSKVKKRKPYPANRDRTAVDISLRIMLATHQATFDLRSMLQCDTSFSLLVLLKLSGFSKGVYVYQMSLKLS